MDVGMMMVFASYGWENCSDARVWDEEIRLARIAAEPRYKPPYELMPGHPRPAAT